MKSRVRIVFRSIEIVQKEATQTYIGRYMPEPMDSVFNEKLYAHHFCQLGFPFYYYFEL